MPDYLESPRVLRTTLPTLSAMRKAVLMEKKLAEQGMIRARPAPRPDRQLLLPFDKLAHAYNRNSSIGVLLRLLKGTQKQFGWKPAPSLAHSALRKPLSVISTLPAKKGSLLLSLTTAEYPITGNTGTFAWDNSIRLTGTHPEEIADTFFHELTHAEDFRKGKMDMYSYHKNPEKYETRAQLKAAGMTRKLFGADQALPYAKRIAARVAKYPNSPSMAPYTKGANLALRLARKGMKK